ncbi:hypothetical protein CTA1_246 [Colletotrichum tanaceti]|uniref:Uncharacterized protein n=1 Tax=Colletotrichum tanaceti TaxID=1306861 RepID=A0A4U6WZ03_9PEZI|nr:hypothetical protein CTA1_246 [Colletotrichum tanaceti]
MYPYSVLLSSLQASPAAYPSRFLMRRTAATSHYSAAWRWRKSPRPHTASWSNS